MMSTAVRRNEKKTVESPGDWLMLQYEHRVNDEDFIPSTAVVRRMAELFPDHARECWMCDGGENLDEAWVMYWKGSRRHRKEILPA